MRFAEINGEVAPEVERACHVGLTGRVIPNRTAAGPRSEGRKAFPQGIPLAGARFRTDGNDPPRNTAKQQKALPVHSPWAALAGDESG